MFGTHTLSLSLSCTTSLASETSPKRNGSELPDKTGCRKSGESRLRMPIGLSRSCHSNLGDTFVTSRAAAKTFFVLNLGHPCLVLNYRHHELT